jgi:hypothetical protein
VASSSNSLLTLIELDRVTAFRRSSATALGADIAAAASLALFLDQMYDRRAAP